MSQSPETLIDQGLSPALVAAGFAAGQVSEPGKDGSRSVLFCASFDELSASYPDLPQANGQERGAGNCVDLTVVIDADGRLESINLEQFSLEQTFRELDRLDQAERVRAILGAPVTESLPQIAAALRELFTA